MSFPRRGRRHEDDEREVVHLADASGTRCRRCGARLCGERQAVAYEAGASVAMCDADASSSWLCCRPPTCRAR